MRRHSYPGSVENEFIKLIRDEELRNPAPFSNQPLLVLDNPKSFEVCPELALSNKNPQDVIGDVFINDIVAISTGENLDDFEFGMTFRDVLFCCLHGHSLIRESLQYFLSDCIKSDRHVSHRGFCSYPQDKSACGKAYGSGGVGVTQRGFKYFVDQGQQRTLLAMFWIYQNEGARGTFKGLRICCERDA